jgi:hypothetical protein
MDTVKFNEYRKEFYQLKLLYSGILEILNSFYSGYLVILDDPLASAYDFLWKEFEMILAKYPDDLKQVVTIGRPLGANSLSPDNFDDPDNPDDIKYTHFGRKQANEITGILDKISDEHKLKLPPVKLLYKHLDTKTPLLQAIEKYKKQKQEAEQNMETDLKQDRNAQEEQKYCRFENNTLFVTLADGTEKAISFDARQETRYMFVLFQVLYKHWQTNKSEPISKNEMRRKLTKERLGRDITDKFIKDTIANIRTSKIKPVGLSDIVKITFDTKQQGYSLAILPPVTTEPQF